MDREERFRDLAYKISQCQTFVDLASLIESNQAQIIHDRAELSKELNVHTKDLETLTNILRLVQTLDAGLREHIAPGVKAAIDVANRNINYLQSVDSISRYGHFVQCDSQCEPDDDFEE